MKHLSLLDKHSHRRAFSVSCDWVLHQTTVWQDSFSCCDNISMYFTYYKGEAKQKKKRKNGKADTKVCS